MATFESCDGGAGHAYPEPTVGFHGTYAEGFRALAIALACGLPVRDLRRVWKVDRGVRGPVWEMTFLPAHLPYDPTGDAGDCSVVAGCTRVLDRNPMAMNPDPLPGCIWLDTRPSGPRRQRGCAGDL